MAATPHTLKPYQQQVLDALRDYLADTVATGDGDTAFYRRTKRPYVPVPALPNLPYVCFRVPTGGGKTLLAAHSIAVAATHYLRTETPVALWFVPSQTIRDQTLAALQDRAHPYRQALAASFAENIRVMGVEEALSARRADYDGGAVIIVATIQGFRVEDTLGRKVYEQNGELMDHVGGLAPAQRRLLEPAPPAPPTPSLANALRLRRPMVIVDEAHNVRTALSFETLARLNPSLVVEFTATPVMPEEHRPAKGIYASNILHQVSAAELKAAEMVKLPVILRGRADPNDTIADAIVCLDELAEAAQAEHAAGGDFVRPIMLLQAEPQSKERETLHAEALKARLMADFQVPETHIALATGTTREIDGVDLFAPDCPIRFIITQQALREGWDCSFAYVLCSVAEQKSARAVEQLLGRVLRMPQAKRKAHEALNQAYAFATTTSFQQAAQTLRDGLVANGFERIEAEALVKGIPPPKLGFADEQDGFGATETLPDEVDLAAIKRNVEGATRGRVQVDLATGMLRARGALTEYDRTALRLALPPAAGPAIDALFHRSRGARITPRVAEGETIVFAVPRLVVRRGGAAELFDRGHFLDLPWKLEEMDAQAILAFFAPPRAGKDEARLDVDTGGQVTVRFVEDLHEQLALALRERNWTLPGLVNWLDRSLPLKARQDITRVSSTLFIRKALDAIDAAQGLGVAGLARAKYRLVDALVKVIALHRDAREGSAFQRALLPQSGLELETSSALALTFEESGYSYNQPYRGGMRFLKHHFRAVGDLDTSGEEYDCAVYLDRLPGVRRWVRNTVKQPNSFWLQTASDKFYPDFIALLTNGDYLVVEYKGSHLITADDAREKQLIGDLWAERSGGDCHFLMIEDRQFGRIDEAITRAFELPKPIPERPKPRPTPPTPASA